MATNHTINSVPHFIYSGNISSKDLQIYINMIEELGGKIVLNMNDQFVSFCTHVLVFSFTSSVKIMGGLASGKWLVSKEFVIQSYKEGRWLGAEQFEVKNNNNNARYRRLAQRKLYDGMTCFLETNNSFITKNLVRVLIAGGATVVSREDIIKKRATVHIAITDKEYLKSVVALFGNTTPIVHLDYIKKTVFFKHNPKNIKLFLLNDTSSVNQGASSSLMDQRALRLRKQPVGTPSTPNQRIIRRTKGQQLSFAKKFNDDNKENFVASKRLKFGHDNLTSDEITVIKEVINPKMDIDLLECSIPTHVKLKRKNHCLEQVEDAKESSNEIQVIWAKESSSRELIPKYGKSSQKNVEVIKEVQYMSIANNLNNCNKENCNSDILSCDEITIIEEIKSPKMNLDLPAQMNLNKTKQEHGREFVGDLTEPSNEIQVIPTTVPSTKEISLTQEKSSELKVINNLNEDKSVEMQKLNLSESSNNSIVNKSLETIKLPSSVSIELNLPRMTKLVSNIILHLNASYFYLNIFHIPVYSYPLVFARELNINESLYSSCYKENDRRIVSKKVGRYKMNVLENVTKTDGDAFDNRLFIMDSLEYVKIRIQADIVPNSIDIGSMIKHHILKFPLKEVSDKALNVFHYLVNRHPPRDRKMRDYYLRVFEIGSDLEVSHQHFKGWSFVRILLKDLVRESDEINYDVNMAVDLVIKLMELDLIYYNETPVSVTSLLCYRIFWIGKSKTPNFMNEAVKELIQIWVDSHKNNSLVMQKITKVLGIMLDLLWKWSDICNPFELSTWPMHSSFMPMANEFLLRFKDPNAENILKLVKLVRIPWQRFYLTSLAFRSKIDPAEWNFEFSISSLKARLDKEIKICIDEKDDLMTDFTHKTKMEFISLLFICYNSSMGVKYCKNELLHQFSRSLKSSDESPKSNASSSDSSSSQSSSSDSSFLEESYSSEKNASADKVAKINIMIKKIVKVFRAMPRHIKEINTMQENCSHISYINFSNAL